MTALEATAAFGRDPAEVSRARRLVAGTLRSWGLADHVTPLELAVSELVSNALRHGGGQVALLLTADPDGAVRLEVRDEGGGLPVLQERSPGDGRLGGWGLHFVAQLSDDWGTVSDDDCTAVWLVRHAASN